MNTFELNLEILRIVIKLHLHTLSYMTARISTELLEIKGPANFFREISIPEMESKFQFHFRIPDLTVFFRQIDLNCYFCKYSTR